MKPLDVLTAHKILHVLFFSSQGFLLFFGEISRIFRTTIKYALTNYG